MKKILGVSLIFLSLVAGCTNLTAEQRDFLERFSEAADRISKIYAPQQFEPKGADPEVESLRQRVDTLERDTAQPQWPQYVPTPNPYR